MKKLEKKHPLAIRWFHWINFPVLSIMIWSGILIYWANDVYRVRLGGHTVFRFFPQWFYHPARLAKTPFGYDISSRLAEGMAYHFLFMWIFAINGALYVLYTAFSGEWRYLLPSRSSFGEAVQVTLYDLHLSRVHPPRRKFNGAQQIAYTGIILMGLGSLLTGLAIYKPVQLSWLAGLLGGYPAARFIHFWLTVGYCLFFVVHVGQVVKTGWNNFRSMISGIELVDDDAPESAAGVRALGGIDGIPQ